jgi:hypothetical protein
MTEIQARAAAEERAEQEFSAGSGVALLWYGFLGGPIAWKLQLMVVYMLVPYACWHDLPITIHLASLVCLALSLSAAWVSWGSWKSVGGHPIGPGGYDETASATLGRSRFMAVSGVLMGLFFGLMIVGQWIPVLVLSPCFGIS